MQNKEKPHAMSVFLSISNYAADLRTQAWVDKSLLANKNHRNWSIAYIQPLRLGKLKTLLRSLKAYLSLSSFLSDDSKSLKRYLGPKESKSLTLTVTGARLLEFIVVCIRTFLFSNAAAVVAILYSVSLLGFELLQSCATLLLLFFRGKILRNTVGSKFSFDTRKLSEKYLRQKT